MTADSSPLIAFRLAPEDLARLERLRRNRDRSDYLRTAVVAALDAEEQAATA